MSSLLARKSKPFRTSSVSKSSLMSAEEEEGDGDTFLLTIYPRERERERERDDRKQDV